MPNAERPYKFWLSGITCFIYLISSAICLRYCTKPTTCGWGVVIMLIGIPLLFDESEG
jgi:APA family basic amino acid/polyamine antiporter